MLVNPGGPGGSGYGVLASGQPVPGSAADHYDWIGFDPRGVGESSPALHCDDDYVGVNRPNFIPTNHRAAALLEVKTGPSPTPPPAATPCMRSLLPMLSTRSTVKDMEYIRAAYHAAAPVPDKPALAKLNFYGFSYGTYLGQVYAMQYPSKVGPFVLDGSGQPAHHWYKSEPRSGDRVRPEPRTSLLQLDGGAQRTFHIGTNPRAIRLGFEQLLKNLDKHPARERQPRPQRLTDALLLGRATRLRWTGSATPTRAWSGSASGGRCAPSTPTTGTSATTTATRCTWPPSAPTPPAAELDHPGARRLGVSIVPVPGLGQHLVQHPCLAWRGRGRPVEPDGNGHRESC